VSRTRGELEAEISRAVVQFEKEYVGRGPDEAKARIFDDIVFVRLTGALTPAEERLAGDADGARLIKEMRLRLMDGSRPALERLVEETTGRRLVSLHTDLSTRTGEQIVVFVLDSSLEPDLPGSGRRAGR
jgi:uncharacterized protein YbcI